MVEINSNELTDAEAEQYDRQIRLWGLDSQKRLRASRVLIIGLKGLGAEVAKNITLAGVKSVTLLDDDVATQEDICSQFLVPRDQIGRNRAEASLGRTQNLNPMVNVTSDTTAVGDHPDEYFHDFEAICATKCSTDQLLRLDKICREKSIKFFCGDVFGFFGFMFADLQTHDFAEEITERKPSSSEEPAAKSLKTVKTTVKRSATFVPLQNALDVDWTVEPYSKKLKKSEPSYFLMKILLKFRSEKKRDPAPGTRVEDMEELLKLKKEVLKEMSIPLEKVPDNLLSLVFAEVGPVCAIVGGVLSQEIIKALSQHEAPHNNMFFFNPERNLGHVECLGA
ncbi:SUMO-activating enzyme subunit 1 [Frankliniella fusca]|uniref:SUMO-activating enzyme subunit 1 n=1 Tax=Frankliniella fusca TaxID=407009 RepID=A0AAE1HR51_9NEOP|nr:SUMO-activating enzyme subunit 1 [Frankliniella fusca]